MLDAGCRRLFARLANRDEQLADLHDLPDIEIYL
jgi:hypothetical protein